MTAMGELRIQRFMATHRVADAPAAARLAQVQRQLLGSELEGALVGFAPGDEVLLVRRLAVPLPLAIHHTERHAARCWSDAIALQLDRLLRAGHGSGVLRFRHRPAAMLDFARRALDGDGSRDWAWRQLAFLPVTAPCSELQRLDAAMRLLVQDSDDTRALLRALHASAQWPRWSAALSTPALQVLACALLRAGANDDAPWRSANGDSAALPAAPVAEQPPALPDGPRRDELYEPTRSRLLEARQGDVDDTGTAWRLRVELLLCEPRWARRGARAIDEALASLGRATLAAREAAPPVQAAPHDPGEGDAPARPPAPDDARTEIDARAPAAVSDEAPLPVMARARSLERTAAPPACAPVDRTADDDAPDRGHTEAGGLLLMLPLLEACGVLALLENAVVWPADRWPCALHRLALSLLPLAADDAAALAFCGLRPHDPIPAPHARLDAAQAHSLEAARSLLQTALCERLPQWPVPSLIERLARRRAQVVADPGWFEVRFSLREVSLDIRRAALDLDPGFLPWLGIVLRYVYE